MTGPAGTSMGASHAPFPDISILEAREAAVRARWYYTLLPLYGLFLILGISTPFALLGFISYGQTVPLLLFIGAIFVVFAGAWSDFGAKGHIREVLHHNLPFNDDDMEYVHKQQFLLMTAYLGVAGLYAVVGVAIILL
jgi:hypothetical protein